MTEIRERLELELREPVSCDQLVGEWNIFQLKNGHRFSTDDLLVAWTAIDAYPQATQMLDIGAGIGSVGLMTLYAMSDQAHLTMVEVQEVSHRLAKGTILHNNLGDRIRAIHQDLRDFHSETTYELITGSPPYIPLGHGLVSPHQQRAGARMELRGDVFDYCRTAKRSLASEGLFCFCHTAIDERPEKAIQASELVLLSRQDVVFREGRPPAISMFICGHQGRRQDKEPLVVRDGRGRWTLEYEALREQMTMRGW